MIFDIRCLTKQDLEWLRRLRNESSKNFFTTAQITPADQERWYHNKPSGDARWVIVDGETSVGYFSIESPRADLPIFPTDLRVRYLNSLLVDPDHRGRGVIQTARMVFAPSIAYVGYVREGNASSLKACAKLGLEDRGLYQHPTIGPIHIVWRPHG